MFGIRRSFAALTLATATLTASAVLASPAHAAGATVQASIGLVTIVGTLGSDSIDISNSGSTVFVTSSAHSVTAGSGCAQEGPSKVSCANVDHISANVRQGDDVVNNNSGLTAEIFGSAGSDRLSGGSQRDILSGGTGNDVLVGNAGNDTTNGGADFDTCDGESELNCEA
ncbi:hypothetical protein [Nonomuraea sp. NEAU-A123]|uniref:calcium-binding protein n=1 Tax=Nonomuraea sp. NEAU-A123 TaxID=2839649 RepID=UPI001BE469DE|nr:hypothetical protein [Nonomuraea sp. NEAU-A123]MBT2232182.1 hypothetical protein [Nonomuraea sp. NEAU-A123]